MCESNAFLKIGEREELLLKDVTRVVPLAGGKLRLENLLGEEKIIAAKIVELDLMGHKLIFG
jgi:predicted RNA-binding protein